MSSVVLLVFHCIKEMSCSFFSVDINKLTFQHIPLLTKQINCPSYLSQTNAMGTFNILNGEDRRVAGELMNRCKLFVSNVCHIEWDGPSSCLASSDDIVASFERGLYRAVLCPSSSHFFIPPSFHTHSSLRSSSWYSFRARDDSIHVLLNSCACPGQDGMKKKEGKRCM